VAGKGREENAGRVEMGGRESDLVFDYVWDELTPVYGSIADVDFGMMDFVHSYFVF